MRIVSGGMKGSRRSVMVVYEGLIGVEERDERGRLHGDEGAQVEL